MVWAFRWELKTVWYRISKSKQIIYDYRLYDIDNNGIIDVDEMTEIIEILDSFSNEEPETPVQTAKEKAEALIELMDVDNSGGITFDEFLKVYFLFFLSFCMI